MTGQSAMAVLAAMKPLQWMAMMELPGWAPEQDSDYADILTLDDISEFSQGEIPEETDSESERTWDHGPRPRTALAATQTQDTGTVEVRNRWIDCSTCRVIFYRGGMPHIYTVPDPCHKVQPPWYLTLPLDGNHHQGCQRLNHGGEGPC
jgi:hypothetical protein